MNENRPHKRNDNGNAEDNSADLSRFARELGLSASPRSLRALKEIATRKSVSSGGLVCWEDEANDHVFLLISGAAKGYKILPNGRSQILRFVVAGEWVGQGGQSSYPYSCEALSSCQLLQFPRARFMAIVEADPLLRQALAETITHELADTHKQILLLGRMAAPERLSHFLLDFAARVHMGPNDRPGEHPVIELPMTRADIADYLGLTIETVSRIFTRLRRDGLIELARPNEVRFRHQARLEGQGETLAA